MSPRERWGLVWRAARLACATKPHDRDRAHLVELAFGALHPGPSRDETEEEVAALVSGWDWRLACALAMSRYRREAAQWPRGHWRRSSEVGRFQINRRLLQGSARCPLPDGHDALCAYLTEGTDWPYVRPPEGHPWRRFVPAQWVGQTCPRCRGARGDPKVRGFCKLCNGTGEVEVDPFVEVGGAT